MAARTIHPFPARMAPDIALSKLAQSPTNASKLVLDPMCGSGTTLVAASESGFNAVGFDMDPLAVLMSKVATTEIHTKDLLGEATGVLATALKDDKRTKIIDPETLKFSEYWFAPKQRQQLNRLACALDDVNDIAVRDALQIALSRIIVTKSPRASLAADTSHSRPHRVLTESSYDVFDGFEKSVRNLASLLEKRDLKGNVTVKRGDSRALLMERDSVDLVITSPPYLNAIDYLRGHKMALIWFGYTIPEIRGIRSNSIGAERALSKRVTDNVESMVEHIEKSVDNPELLPAQIIKRYANDLVEFAECLYRVVRTGAEVVTVIGNSTLRGNYIRNDELVCLAYESAGFQFRDSSERELPENRRYMPINRATISSSMSKRMRTEVVMTVKKQ